MVRVAIRSGRVSVEQGDPGVVRLRVDSSDQRFEIHQRLDAIEASLESGRLFVFPGRGTRLSVLLRRFAPGLVWRVVHWVEGF